jgi:alkaline phosphatase D
VGAARPAAARSGVRFPDGEKIGRFRIAASLADYRTLVPRLSAGPGLAGGARAGPSCRFGTTTSSRDGGSRCGASWRRTPRANTARSANQAWFEYQPARVAKSGGVALERLRRPAVKDAPIGNFDGDGLGQSRTILRPSAASQVIEAALGPAPDLIITDQHSYRSEDPSGRPEASASSNDFPNLVPGSDRDSMPGVRMGRACPRRDSLRRDGSRELPQGRDAAVDSSRAAEEMVLESCALPRH